MPRFAVLVAASLLALGAEASPAPPPPPRPALVELPLPPDVPMPFATGTLFPKNRDLYFPTAAAAARARGLPPEVADAVMRVESAYNPAAIGGDGERGLMQVMPPTAALLGFRGSDEELAEPGVNIELGVRYLAEAWRLAGGDLCRALMKYRAGHREERMSLLSVEYCRRAKAHLAALGSPLGAGELPAVNYWVGERSVAAAPAVPGVSGAKIVRIAGRLRRVMPVRTAATSKRFWAAQTARIKAIEAKLPWRKDSIMAGS